VKKEEEIGKDLQKKKMARPGKKKKKMTIIKGSQV